LASRSPHCTPTSCWIRGLISGSVKKKYTYNVSTSWEEQVKSGHPIVDELSGSDRSVSKYQVASLKNVGNFSSIHLELSKLFAIVNVLRKVECGRRVPRKARFPRAKQSSGKMCSRKRM